MKIQTSINGKSYTYEGPDEKLSLLTYLRERLGIVGTKNGCGEGHCGACMVMVDGKAVLACRTQLEEADGREIETIEGLSTQDSVSTLIYAFAKAGAVQCGFCSPGFIMSTKALLDNNPSPTEDQIKKALARNVCRCTGYRKIIDAVDLAANLRRQGKLWIERKEILPTRECEIGESIIKVDAIPKAAGETVFADDMKISGMLHTKVLRSSKPHALISNIDISKALAIPGVVKVLLACDIPGENKYGPITKDQPVLAKDRVRYMGDAIAAVFAESLEIAQKAVDAISLRYEELPVLEGFDEALKPGAIVVHEGSNNTIAIMEGGRGDIEKGFNAASLIIEGDYETQYIEHAYLEPESCIATFDSQGFLSVYVASQGPPMDIAEISPVIGIVPEKIRIIGMPMGGGFGGKEDISVQIIASLGALATGRPVKYTFTRRESIRTSGKRHATRMLYRTGVDSEGKITAIKARIQARGGAYASVEEAVILRSTSFAGGPYTIPAADIKAQAVYQNHAPACAMRGFGNPVVTFAAETSMNRIADALGIDPIELRLRNALDIGMPTITGDRLTTSVGIKDCLTSIRQSLADYKIPEMSEEWASGIGIAASYKNVGLGIGMDDSGGASGEILEDGRLLLRVGSVDMGQGSNSTMVQILSARLGWPVSRISVHSADTSSDPLAGMTTASRQTFITGNAVLRLADALKAEIAVFLAKTMKTSPLEILIKDSTIFTSPRGAKPDSPRISLDELLALLKEKGRKISAAVRYRAPDTRFSLKEPVAGYASPLDGKLHAAYCFAAQATALSVHRKTGKVLVHDVFIACDAGRIINRQAIEGQMHGGVVMGLGYALTEEYREEKGVVKTDSFGKLGVLRIGQVPRIHCDIIENPHADGPYGAKGMGELPLSMGAPSVAHAIHEALGIWLFSLPLKPDKILSAIEASAKPRR
jgi:CO/xanthine dehydrogenase Mo-binding subunit/aerobic-type carbon monoxide dehydrogenase small subunit (CoxS/CutS family)